MSANDAVNSAEVATVGYGASSYIEMLLGLAAVVLVILALAWLAKRYALMTPGISGVIKITAAMSLGNRDRIALVEVGGKEILLGISPGRVSTLHVFGCDDDAFKSRGYDEKSTRSEVNAGEPTNPEKATFAARLKSAISKNGVVSSA